MKFPWKRAFALTGFGVLGLVVVAQFFRPARNVGDPEGPQALVSLHPVPPDVKAVLVRSCYDCHSNQTRYPWYAEVQPLGWWLAQHVREGKQELNLSEFGHYSSARAVRKLEALMDEVYERRMPLNSYLRVHRGARLSDAEVQRIEEWAEELIEAIESR